ncbi:hypothetical protein AWN90_10555 [Nocardia terpenica]|uniref:Uncharacterized protein n=1 Tax=Nocardia terpenica TaxID=455432 RepID=A0A164H9S5_9NOCA|nr:hypothetical protein AWN90_10555 [Nocardia terpenica]
MLWESSELDLLSGLPVPFSARWPRSGSMQSGYAYERPTSERVIDAPESSSPPPLPVLPTPTARDHKGPANKPGRTRAGRTRTIGDDSLPDAIERM